MTNQDVLAALANCVGPGGLLTDPDVVAPYLTEWTRRYPGEALAVARPASTAEVAALVNTAISHNISIVPQGGNTGVVGGAAAQDAARAITLSLTRMRTIRSIDPDTPSIVAEAGCVLADVQAAAIDAGLSLPLGLGAEGTATVGGLVSTNAGGIRALRYGVTRNLVLGLEVVLPDGRIWNGLRTVAKNNMGYDLKQLFIGAEGTLGIVTAAALRPSPAWRQIEAALIAVPDPAAALALLGGLRRDCGDVVVACELIEHFGLELAALAIPDLRRPLGEYPCYVLVELADITDHGLRDRFMAALANALEAGVALDGVIAESEAQRREFWRIREGVVEGLRLGGKGVRFDVAVPIGAVPAFIAKAGDVARAILPGVRPFSFGHVGDGNIHYSIFQPPGGDTAFAAASQDLEDAVHALTIEMGGSICAEHGVGRKMRDSVADAVGPVEADLYRAIKTALDPDGRMNPGVLI